jgi:NTP pyrophosphatase (non-canonical NTP hydrolase)
MITSENYVDSVLKTESPITQEIIARLTNPTIARLIHATMGIVTEAGELTDMLKKHLFYGKPLDMINAAEEVGDSMWYIGLAIDIMKTTMNDIMSTNIQKLKIRYPEKFTENNALNRDLNAERKVLERS